MSDQIKVLSRDVPKNLIDWWGMFKACLTYRKTRPGCEREFYEIDKQVVDKFDLLINGAWEKLGVNKMRSYPKTNDMEVAVEHVRGEQEPAWEPGTVAATSYGYFRLDSKDGHYWHGVYIVTFPCSPIPRGDERLESEKSFQGIHRLPHEFKVGDWFECLSVHCHTPGPMIVHKVREASISDDGGSWHPIDFCRHSPPPKDENPKKRAWDLGAVGGQSSDCVPPPKEEKPSQEKTNTKKWEDWKVYFNEYKELIVRVDSMLSLLEHRGYIKHELSSCPESVEVQQLIGDLRNAAARAVETSERFSGPWWYRAKRSAKHPEEKFTHYEAAQCLCDLKDAWLEKEGKG